jgi:hypothetical protein
MNSPSLSMPDPVNFVLTFDPYVLEASDRAALFARTVDCRAYFLGVVSSAEDLQSTGLDRTAIAELFAGHAKQLSRIHETLFPQHDGLGLNIRIDLGLRRSESIDFNSIRAVLSERAVEMVATVKARFGSEIIPYILGIFLKSAADQIRDDITNPSI